MFLCLHLLKKHAKRKETSFVCNTCILNKLHILLGNIFHTERIDSQTEFKTVRHSNCSIGTRFITRAKR
jgi:hypothetical protein